MKNIFPLFVVLFFLTGYEKNEPGPEPHADWKVVDIPTGIHLNKVFFVNEKTGFVAGTFNFQKLKVVISTVADEGYWWYIKNDLYKGNIYTEQGEYEKAMKTYNCILEKDDLYLVAYLQRGKIFYAMGEIEKAAADSKR